MIVPHEISNSEGREWLSTVASSICSTLLFDEDLCTLMLFVTQPSSGSSSDWLPLTSTDDSYLSHTPGTPITNLRITELSTIQEYVRLLGSFGQWWHDHTWDVLPEVEQLFPLNSMEHYQLVLLDCSSFASSSDMISHARLLFPAPGAPSTRTRRTGCPSSPGFSMSCSATGVFLYLFFL